MMHKTLIPNDDNDRLYIKRKREVSGINIIEDCFRSVKISRLSPISEEDVEHVSPTEL